MMKIRNRILLLSLAVMVTIPVTTILFGQKASAEQAGTFKGSWIASGQRQTLDFLADREVGTFELTGHVNLQDEVGEEKDEWAECVGLSDSVAGSTARCVWRSMENEKVFITLEGRPFKKGVKVTGEIVGGTGNLKGIEGKLAFTWFSVFTNKNQGIFTGHTKDLTGSYRIP